MIVVRLVGGLGNQMFQYATARSLASHHHTSVLIDPGWFDEGAGSDASRAYELSHFALTPSFVRRDDLTIVGPGAKSTVKKNIYGLLGRKNVVSAIREKHYHFDPALLLASDNVYLDGYWQSEKYFKDEEGLIRNEFKFRSQPDAKNREVLKKIEESLAISIHVRHGDYLKNPVTKKFHGVMDISYYKKAVELMESKVQNPTFFIFSDDPEWCRKNFKLKHRTVIVDHNPPTKGYEDMRLMSLCKHHIVANSSFSWWGAWLNPQHQKTVIAPMKWFADKSVDTSDLIPGSWIRL